MHEIFGILEKLTEKFSIPKMEASEKRFWEKFLSRAQIEIDKASDGTKGFPIEPSKILQRQYIKAIEKYDGLIYCQIRQLQYYFRF